MAEEQFQICHLGSRSDCMHMRTSAHTTVHHGQEDSFTISMQYFNLAGLYALLSRGGITFPVYIVSQRSSFVKQRLHHSYVEDNIGDFR